MRKILCLFLGLGLAVQASAQTPNSLIPYRIGNLWGYANREGQLVIPAEYEETTILTREGYGALKADGKWGFVDLVGEWITTPRYTSFTLDASITVSIAGNPQVISTYNARETMDGPSIKIDGGGRHIVEYYQPYSGEYTQGNQIQGYDMGGPPSLKGPIQIYPTPTPEGMRFRFTNAETGYESPPIYEILIPSDTSLLLQDGAGQPYLIGRMAGKWGIIGPNGDTLLPFEYRGIELKRRRGWPDLIVLRNESNKVGVVLPQNFEIMPCTYQGIDLDFMGRNTTPPYVWLLQDNLYWLYQYHPQLELISTEGYQQVNSFNEPRGFYRVTTASGQIGYVRYDGLRFFQD